MMYKSKFSKKLMAYLLGKKKYLVSIEIDHPSTSLYLYLEFEVMAKSRNQARQIAANKAKEEVTVTAKMVKSLGRQK